jgi:hypothetical protein
MRKRRCQPNRIHLDEPIAAIRTSLRLFISFKSRSIRLVYGESVME